MYRVYVYANDFLAAAASFGIAFPVSVASQQGQFDLGKAIGGMPNVLKIITVLSVTIYVILKVYITREEAAKKSALAQDCDSSFRNLYTTLIDCLDNSNPMPKLEQLHLEICNTVRKYDAVDTYPDYCLGGHAPTERIEHDADQMLRDLITKFGPIWDPPPPLPRFEPPS